MKTFQVRVETNRLWPNGNRFDIDNYPDASVADAVQILNAEGLELSAEDVESLTNHTFRHWVGPTCFKQVHIFTA